MFVRKIFHNDEEDLGNFSLGQCIKQSFSTYKVKNLEGQLEYTKANSDIFGSDFFFTKNSIVGSYMKAWSTNYKY